MIITTTDNDNSLLFINSASYLFEYLIQKCYGFMDEGLPGTLLATLLGGAECCYSIRSSVSRPDPLPAHRYLPTGRLS